LGWLGGGSGLPGDSMDGEEFEEWLWREGEGSEGSFDSLSSGSIRGALFRSLGYGGLGGEEGF